SDVGRRPPYRRFRGAAAPGADRADPARRRAARRRHRQRHRGGGHGSRPAAMDRRPGAVDRRSHAGGVRRQARSRLRRRTGPPSPPEGVVVVLNLAEYRRTADRLADHLPWAALVAPGVILNKDGSFQRTLRFRGPDLESATEAELVGASARANNVLKRFGSGWALFFEAERRESQG